ncbi:recombination inhibitory protein MutS2 [Porphyromonas crevioricanis JCM 15906]|uniref:Endonuclease MutS2 n=1 Tax=Porphyromonas crevioricanis JCM 15906 TaxID=1305617 RepID=T1CQM6_9PORP|nr:Smr/MutS family protein [Porphyromonas crevioricanis]GAD06137.1 recombination inhibitory protein MutS2 [Porphyromonas crevioricanis JCM 15906]SJZ82098.1 DNA mismatch repair protein MutS2 [Porphyromonas crevioricanis]
MSFRIYPSNFEAKIGFDELRRLLSSYCGSELGQELVSNLHATDDFTSIEAWLHQTAEMLLLIRQSRPIPSIVETDCRLALRRIRPEGTYLEQEELLSVLHSMQSIEAIVAFVAAHNVPENEITVPYLQRVFSGCHTYPDLSRHIASLFDVRGKIADTASPELGTIRREISQIERQMSRLIERAMRHAKAEGYMEADAMPTVRDGRVVLPIIPSHKRALGGIVQGESTTGRTVFVEPAEVVEAGNRLRELEGEERREIIRILIQTTAQIRSVAQEIIRGIAYLAQFDLIVAKAKFAHKFNGNLPHLSPQPDLLWVGATHPVLQQSLSEHGRSVVPLDITLSSDNRILVISGPNAGGKSVCLKTVGIVQYMLQCGLLPTLSPDSRVGIFGCLAIDIGDEQSLEDDLSTYSSHLKNMKEFIRLSSERSLLLIDEFGSGTEPRIGGAIAQALLHRFNQAGCRGLVTTHYHNLKLFADDTRGLVNAAMLYDRHEMRPLFKLSIGRPGSSFAIEIARKTGLPEDVIDMASELVGQDYTDMDKYLQDIIRDKRYWESKREKIRREEKRLTESADKYARQLESFDTERKRLYKEAAAEAGRLLDEARSRIEGTVRSIKEAKAEREETLKARRELEDFRRQIAELGKTETANSQPKDDRYTRELEKLKRRKERKAVGKVPTSGLPVEPERQSPVAPPRSLRLDDLSVGDLVKIKGQQALGRILEINSRDVCVALGMLKVNVSIDKILLPNEREQEQADKQQEQLRDTRVSRHSNVIDTIHNKRLQFKADLDVRGMRAAEAIDAVAYFVDDAIQLSVPRVRILHGTGSGALRMAIRDYLSGVVGVRQYKDEHVQFGGAGITVVDLN